MSKTSRREFFGAPAAALATHWAGAAPHAAGAPAGPGPNDIINLGLIGCGARGRQVIIPGFQKLPGVRFVAVCDVNSKHLADGRQRAGGERVAAYRDFRKLVEDKNVDVVIIATNQHWHVLPTIAACQAGKDVLLAKPLGNSIGEGSFAIEAARKYRRLVGVDTQQRSQEFYHQAVELIQSGKLGEISEVRVWDYENQWPGPGSPPDCAPPEELDWEFYVGPAPYRAYNPNIYYNLGYDWFKLSGGGHQVAWGVHHFDIVLWAMGVKWPETVFATGGDFAFQSNREWPNTFSATLRFGPGPVAKRGFVLNYEMRVGGRRETRSHGKCFLGTQASLLLDRSGYAIVKEMPGAKIVSSGAFISPEETVSGVVDQVLHFKVFLDNVRQRKQPFANLETCHYASNVAHLMNISHEVGRSIRWGGANHQVIGDSEANALVLKPYRAPWKLEV
ncbi:MAG: Gfo/Idh/MocA family oxidoreductase [Acidobacteria bacterium]|nr:Gfo/Idh/MocA family oxidoreductase [Acidobacteriota bacterium]